MTTSLVCPYDPPVIVRHGREVTTLMIDSPATRNALSSTTLADLAAALAGG